MMGCVIIPRVRTAVPVKLDILEMDEIVQVK